MTEAQPREQPRREGVDSGFASQAEVTQLSARWSADCADQEEQDWVSKFFIFIYVHATLMFVRLLSKFSNRVEKELFK